MGKSRKKSRYGDLGHVRLNSAFHDTMSVYRPVISQPNQLKPVRLIQDYVVDVLEQGGIRSGISRVALDSLRMVMMPTQDLRRVHQQNPMLTSSTKVQRHITRSVPSIEEAFHDIQGTYGVVLSGDGSSFAAIAFGDPGLVEEQRTLYDALGEAPGSVRVPTMGIVVMPRVSYDIAQRLNTGLSAVAGDVSVAVGAAMLDIRGSH
jgi:hypothetical protein